MRFALFFDVHLGHAGSEKWVSKFKGVLDYERSLGSQIVFGGDFLDLVENTKVNKDYYKLIRESDIYIIGNHDPFFVPSALNRYRFRYKDVLVYHGDQLDVHYILALLNLMTKGLIRREHAYLLYQSLVSIDDKFIKDKKYEFFEAIRNLKNVNFKSLSELVYLINILIKTTGEVPEYFYHPNDIKIFDVYTLNAKTILEKMLYLEPEVKEASTIVLGHLHPPTPIDEIIDGKRVIVSSSWVSGTTSYVVIDDKYKDLVKVVTL
jgi:UDP-2,3-diacylglucosamine pyrophosphatase LpxH